MENRRARVIALYLPQFHETEVNDRFWGKGFTEWTNVESAVPLFKGHLQPNEPGELGRYNLLNPETRAAQAKLAQEAGIEGFCYWHYWFGGGQETLTRPLDEVIRLGEPDLPFCVGWANHDWTTASWKKRRNQGQGQYIFRQTFPGREDEKAHFERLLPAFRDRRYLKVDGKLLFLVYDPMKIPDASAWMEHWNELADRAQLPGFHFVGLADPIPRIGFHNLRNPEWGIEEAYARILSMGFQAVMPVNQKYAELRTAGPLKKVFFSLMRRAREGMILERYHYPDIIEHYYTSQDSREDVYPQILAGWDRSPRSGRRAIIYDQRTPEAFERMVAQAVHISEGKAKEHRILFLNSWNEWGEGAYVEPDRRFGHGFLRALRRQLISDGQE